MPKVRSQYMGDVWPEAQPGSDPVLYGSVDLTPTGAFEARSLQTFSLIYTVGRFGLDDTGSIKVVHRYSNDWGYLQTVDPTDYNYVTASASNGSSLHLVYQDGGEQRPWYRSLRVMVTGDGLYEGDTITIVFGDRSGGSPGLKLQTFCESGFEFKVLADVCATGHFLPVQDTPAIAIIPGPPAVWKAVLPSLRRPGEKFRLGLKAEDLWGNPTEQVTERLYLKADQNVAGLPDHLDYGPGQRGVMIDDLSMAAEATVRISVSNAGGDLLAESNPLIIRDGGVSGYWGDMHGQSGESVGINTAKEYFHFARNLAFLDATSHQANDFQINNAFWDLINELTDAYQEDHRFVTYPGYEWSGNTAVGGDRNVFFREEGRQIHRSSHALLPDRSDIDTDSNTAAELFEDLQGEDCVVYAHVGGRYADIRQAHDPVLESAMEIHSAWGTFEWLLTDGFALGHRSGVVCNSDGHKGRPGASYPGAASFGAYGGLTCFYASELTRDGLFDCLRRRHHFGTTGNRMHLDVRAQFDSSATLFERDPRYFVEKGQPANEVMMGDIVQTDDDAMTLSVECVTQTPIERIDILNGTDLVDTIRGYDEGDLGNRIRVIWQGAEYRGRGRQTTWRGHARLTDGTYDRIAPINAWNHERPTRMKSDDLVTFDTLTTGNFGGFDAWITEGSSTRITIETDHVSGEIDLKDIGLGDTVLDAGGLERKIRVFRLPTENPCRALKETGRIPLAAMGDNPIWVRVTTEDGFNAWSSPIFAYRQHSDPLKVGG
ncbi:MAG: DUF3604 domain-containing protein [Rhodospirillales bacterium]|nr:DUF3604 domain-containing protein [Rhodospirillales bacterium]MBT4041328.1 DUF3604 domain-containing protein [Rhodospirillales bacterium]MBT4626975.1 DUF3604 domain-containing protein [Rhodospirillales bacterium]MBT5352205.1 DUF3604 domain-containing protein [Rhodospirillales bacterium]MBT5520558.1 DUF3604 domain-containing protein [Rhodospirillales bacterium]